MNLPNQLTFLRAVLGVVCGILLSVTDNLILYFVCLAIFVVAAITDLLDGYFARKMNLESDFGKIADPIADKILNLSSLFALSYRGIFSMWWLLPVAIREIAVTAFRVRRVLVGEVIAAEFAGKVKTVVQYVAIAFAFLLLVLEGRMPDGLAFQVLRICFMLSLISAVVLTVYSGIIFFLKANRGSN